MIVSNTIEIEYFCVARLISTISLIKYHLWIRLFFIYSIIFLYALPLILCVQILPL